MSRNVEPQLSPPPERFDAAAHLLALNAGRGDALAYIDDTQRMSFGEFDARVRRCAAGLLALGLRVIEFIVELQKTATGKIQRFRLRERSVS